MRFSVISFIIAAIQCAAQSPADFINEPIVQWRFKTGAPIFSSPVVSDGLAYFGSNDSTLYAVEARTGNQKWKLKTNGEIRSTPVIAGEKLYLLGGNGVLSCVEKNTGKVSWRKVFDNTALFLGERKYDFADYYHSSPLVHSGSIYFGSGNGSVNAVRAEDGELLWTFKAGDIVHNTPVIIKDKLYIGSFDGFIYALQLSTGQLQWKFKSVGQRYFPKGEVQGSPAAGHGMIFVGTRDYNMYALDATGGNANWNRKFTGGWALSATIADTVLYIGTSDDRLLLAVDARDGRELWKTDVKFNIFGNCVFTPSLVYVGSIWGKLFAIDRKTGAIRWSFTTDGFTANHLKYFKADDTFRDDIGRTLKSPMHWIAAEMSMGAIFSTPAITGDMIIVTTCEGVVYGLRRN